MNRPTPIQNLGRQEAIDTQYNGTIDTKYKGAKDTQYNLFKESRVRVYMRAPCLALWPIHAWMVTKASVDGAESKHGWSTKQAWMKE